MSTVEQNISLVKDFTYSRDLTRRIVEPLEVEDFGIQAMTDVSPPKWHLAHTTWFYEDFILKQYKENYNYVFEDTRKLFNSYYETLSKPFPKSQRGLISRPTVQQIFDYRNKVEEQVLELLNESGQVDEQLTFFIRLGIWHEQQHQELLLTDMKYNFSVNPLLPVYKEGRAETEGITFHQPVEWKAFEEGLTLVGTNDASGSFDNEQPEHKHYLYPFQIANRPVTNGEYIAFIEDGGYTTPDYWLSEGWSTVQEEEWHAPLYWWKEDGTWYHFTLAGAQPLDKTQPVSHVSYYEADAFARWAGCRLPSEQEWEHAFKTENIEGNFLETYLYDESRAQHNTVFGTVWEWTRSPYSPYPESARPDGALGEYNAKFMSNQMVLRGGSTATPQGHIRPTYRNFFHPDKRWQFSGIRLAKDGRV
ncbi:ergothioneine biosynthesis protein EgtB [Salsuginibacillus kocurii]|uniref:ergothioneine biosynthesis protein EgtB n=1 Tax=Salsuginibacillus kocurii TaxID=427078 RepID=UPI00036D164D|nr:ergothioneine biosynthesis protein EgtB [Salsuginibacillus kocurii]